MFDVLVNCLDEKYCPYHFMKLKSIVVAIIKVFAFNTPLFLHLTAT